MCDVLSGSTGGTFEQLEDVLRGGSVPNGGHMVPFSLLASRNKEIASGFMDCLQGLPLLRHLHPS